MDSTALAGDIAYIYACCQRIALAAVETDSLDSRMRGQRHAACTSSLRRRPPLSVVLTQR